MTAQPQERQKMSVAEYLSAEESAEVKSEYWNGEAFAMAGSAPEHAAIAFNLAAAVKPGLRGKGCRGWSPDLRVKAGSGLYTYTDMAILCGEPRFEQLPGQGVKTLVNPTVLVEVLSDSTEARDRGFKFAQYRTLPSLREYVLVHQDRPCVEVFARQPGDTWLLTEFAGMEAHVVLESIGLRIPLAEIYDGVELRSAPDGAGGRA